MKPLRASKLLTALVVIGFCMCFNPSVTAQQVTGSTLSIGVGNNLTANYISGAVGYQNTITGWGCFGIGYLNTATGSYSIASGYLNQIAGTQSGAFGYYNIVPSSNSFAFGYSNIFQAGSDQSVALGTSNRCSNFETLSIGVSNTSSGSGAITLGTGTKAESYQQVVVGAYNVPLTNPAPNPTAWVGADPIFVIGNGTSTTATSTAMKVLKNGTTSFYGTVLINAAGDLPMGTYTNGPQP